jgi:PAS domain S-box-containing protein
MKRIPRAKNIRRPATQKSKIGKTEDIKKLIHLLQINQIELEHQNQELRIAQEELEVSRTKYVNLFDFAPIPYFTLDMKSTIKEANINAGRMFSIDRKNMIGKNFITYVPLTEREMFNSFIKAIFDSPTKQSCEVNVLNKEKRAVHVRVEGAEVADTLDSDRKCQVAVIELMK